MNKLTLFIFTFLGFLSYSQIVNGTIVSSEDNSPIGFVKIGVENLAIGNLTDENGNFKIDLTGIDKNSKIKIEVAGFETYMNDVSTFTVEGPIKISLNPKITNIEEVSILGKNYIEQNLGSNSKMKKPNILFISRNSDYAKKNLSKEQLEKIQNPEVAIQIDSKKKSKILRINMNFAKFELTNSINSRFTIYSEKNGLPNEIINSEDILFDINKNNIKDGVFTLNVSDKNIWIKDKIFIAYQILEPNFNDEFRICAGLFGKGFLRVYVENWQKTSAGVVPAINIDVKTEK